jgi:hypothetical protein
VHSAPCADISAEAADAKRRIIISAKVQESTEGFAAFKASRTRYSYAFPTLLVEKSIVILNLWKF